MDRKHPRKVGGEEELPDWLKAGLDASQADQPAGPAQDDWPEITPPSEEETAFQDFLSLLDEEEPAEQAASGPTPGWMSETPEPEPLSTSITPSHQDDLADWIPGEEQGPVDPDTRPPAQEAPAKEQDWFSEGAAAEPEGGSIFQSQEEEIPDWLSALGISSDASDPQPPAPQPDWLEGAIGGEDEATPTFQSKEQAPSDWFSDAQAGDLGDEQDSASGFGRVRGFETLDDPGILEPVEPPAYHRPGDHTPDWLRSLSSETELEETGDDQEPFPVGEEDLQSWFSELDNEDKPESKIEPASSSEEMPGWLKSLGSVVTGTVKDDSLPDMGSEDSTPFVGQDEFDDDLLDVESLPAWLTPESIAPEEEKREDSGLAVAELPGWLEAMRPVEREALGAPLDNGPVESAGPLAGLRAVLPAEAEINRYKKPPVYSAKLRVTDSQLAQADLIQKLLSQEGDSLPIPEPPLVSSQRALRWLTAIILSIVIGFVVIGGSQFVPLPGRNDIPAATYDSSRVINALPDQAQVLLAFDYEPGTAGEMHAAAAALVDHLMLKAARLTLVSTLTTGPAVAEYFVQNVQNQHNYTSGNQYINLGYIPGGATGLLSFAQNPQWVFPQSYDGLSPWDASPLQGITSIADFDLVGYHGRRF